MFAGLSSKQRRIGVATAAVVALGAAITVVTLNSASASHGGLGTVGLSATNGTNIVTWQSVSGAPAPLSLPASVTATDGAWSPDGSRLAFVDGAGAIRTVRYNKASDVGTYAEATGDPRSRPTWTDDGSVLLWSSQVSDGGTGTIDVLEYSTGDGQGTNLVALPTDTNWTFPDGGLGTKILVQGQQGAGQPNIYAIDETNLADDSVDPGSPVVTNGSSPAAAPDDSSIAFLRSTGGHVQVFDYIPATDTTVQVTSDAADHSNPTWSPDGTTIAFDEGTDVFTAAADGSQAGSPVGAGLSGVPAYQPKSLDIAARFAGANRYDTAIAISQGNWADGGDQEDGLSADAVVLSRGDTFADALGGSALAAAKHGPLLLTPPTSLYAPTANEIKRVLGADKTKTVYIVGGTSAISTGVENAVRALGYAVVRISGANRFATAVGIAGKISTAPGLVLVATGLNFPDALSAGAAAGSFDVPGSETSAVVVLTNDSTMPTDTKTYLNGLAAGANPPVVIGVGGSAVNALVGANIDGFGIVGANRYETATEVADFLFQGPNVFGVATGLNFPDALAGGALLGTLGGPLLLTTPTASNANVSQYLDLDSASLSAQAVFGDTGVVSNAVSNAYVTLISGPGGFLQVPTLVQRPAGQASALGKRAASAPASIAPHAANHLPDFSHLPSYVKRLK